MITYTQFDTLKKKYYEVGLDAFLKQFDEIKQKWRNGQDEVREHRRLHAPEWNIFRFLGVERYEAAFHTPFLAELLSPNGSHGQGQFFMETFLENVARLPVEDIRAPGWYVWAETEYVDLRVANDSLKKAVIIENKIDTKAHSGQLSRYFQVWRRDYPNGGVFAYLTIHGDPPPNQGFDTSPDFPKRAEIEANLKLWSYKDDILTWLTEIIEEITPQALKQSIIQYIDVIIKL